MTSRSPTSTMDVIRDINSRYWQECTGFHILILLYTGNWPQIQGERNIYLKLARILPFLALGGMIFAMLIALYDLQFKLQDYGLLAEAILYIIMVFKSMIISIIGVFKIQEVVRLFLLFEDFMRYVVDAEERRIFERYRRKTKWFTIINMSLWVGCSLVFTISPLFEAERRFPFHYNLPLESPLFEMFYLTSVVSGLGSTLLLSGFDSIVISAFVYFTGYLEILQYKLEHSREISMKRLIEEMSFRQATGLQDMLAIMSRPECIAEDAMIIDQTRWNLNVPDVNENQDEAVNLTYGREIQQVPYILNVSDGNQESSIIDIDDSLLQELFGDVVTDTTGNAVEEAEKEMAPEMNSNVDKRDLDVDMRRHLGECVQLHQDLIRFLGEIQHMVDYVLFLHLVFGAVNLCLSMFITTQVPFGSAEMFIWSIFFLLILEELYGYCWASSKLIEESVQVSDAMYFSDWTEASPSYKRSMLIIMSRAVLPLEISTMNFLTFDMEMFSNVVHSAYSYLNVMNKMNRT